MIIQHWFSTIGGSDFMVIEELRVWLENSIQQTGFLYASKKADDKEALRLQTKNETLKMVLRKVNDHEKQFKERAGRLHRCNTYIKYGSGISRRKKRR